MGAEKLGEWGIIESAWGLYWKNYSINHQNAALFIYLFILVWLLLFTVLSIGFADLQF